MRKNIFKILLKSQISGDLYQIIKHKINSILVPSKNTNNLHKCHYVKNLCCLCDFLNAHKNYGIKQTLSLFTYKGTDSQRTYAKNLLFFIKSERWSENNEEWGDTFNPWDESSLAHILNVNEAQKIITFHVYCMKSFFSFFCILWCC